MSRLLILALFVFFYAFPVGSGRFYENADSTNIPYLDVRTGYSQRHGLDFHQLMPEYIDKLISYLRLQDFRYRILAVPSGRTQSFRWGFSSNTDPIMEVQRLGVLTEKFGEGFSVPDSYVKFDSEIKACMVNLTDCGEKEFTSVMQKFSIKYVLLRGDMLCGQELVDCPSRPLEKIAESLSGHSIYKSRIDFGLWSLFEFDVPPYSNYYPDKQRRDILGHLETFFFPSLAVISPGSTYRLNIPEIGDWYAIRWSSVDLALKWSLIKHDGFGIEFTSAYPDWTVVIYSSLLIFLVSSVLCVVLIIYFGVVLLWRKKY